MASPTTRTRSKRLEVRTTSEERSIIDRAVEESGTDLTTFVVTHVTDAALRVLADRDHFVLSPDAQRQWDELNSRPARDLPGLRRLLERPTPFTA